MRAEGCGIEEAGVMQPCDCLIKDKTLDKTLLAEEKLEAVLRLAPDCALRVCAESAECRV